MNGPFFKNATPPDGIVYEQTWTAAELQNICTVELEQPPQIAKDGVVGQVQLPVGQEAGSG